MNPLMPQPIDSVRVAAVIAELDEGHSLEDARWFAMATDAEASKAAMFYGDDPTVPSHRRRVVLRDAQAMVRAAVAELPPLPPAA